jgi:hypothetical protein
VKPHYQSARYRDCLKHDFAHFTLAVLLKFRTV